MFSQNLRKLITRFFDKICDGSPPRAEQVIFGHRPHQVGKNTTGSRRAKRSNKHQTNNSSGVDSSLLDSDAVILFDAFAMKASPASEYQSPVRALTTTMERYRHG
jgi:hypothetical protein